MRMPFAKPFIAYAKSCELARWLFLQILPPDLHVESLKSPYICAQNLKLKSQRYATNIRERDGDAFFADPKISSFCG